MAGPIIIGSVTGGKLTPDAELTYNTDGTITGHAVYCYATTDSPSPIGSAHPDDSRAIGVEYTLRFDEAFQWVTVKYRGVWSTSAVRVDIQAGLQANPIETHPNFGTLGGTPASPANGAIYDSTGVFLGWPAGAPSNLGGVRFYLAAANTYRFTFATTSDATAASAVANTGAVASSITAGNATFSQTNGFMLQSVTLDYEYVGSSTTIYTISNVWVSTQPPGWNTAIYPP
jgi:hypothetical protein